MSVDWKITLCIVARIITDHFYFQNYNPNQLYILPVMINTFNTVFKCDELSVLLVLF